MNIQVIIPLVIFLVAIFAIGFIASKQMNSSGGFLQEYFLGGRELGGFVLAMTMVATYGSASSFLGGPGTAYTVGFGWILLAMTQVVTGYFVLLILGKKFAILGRKYNAVTMIDFLKARYNSPTVAILSAIAIIIFLFSAMTAQWVGGGRLIESLTGLEYTTALFIFAISVLVYVTIGGFRAVALTDAVQGAIMVVGTLILLIGVIIAGGGVPAIMQDLLNENPRLVTPFGADGTLSAAYVSSFWILVGVGVVGLPQMAVRAMSYKSSRAMHRALVIGTIVTGFIMLNMHLIGIFARPIMPGITVGDKVIPLIALEVLPPWLAGIVLAAPMAAIMSTVDSLLLLVSSAIVKDVYLNFIKPEATERRVKQISVGVTGILGIIVFLLAIQPPDLLIFLNLFAFGGLEAAFIWPVVLGLYWKYGNKYGALLSMITGIVSYIAIHFYNSSYGNLFGVHTVTLPVLLSLIAYIIGSLAIQRKAFRF
ncbi:sodium/pantothenate symporter [Sporosarcina highlanderae]|uniref:Sodium/pantothenate symporter n=1 Tax=Sporosarcina highlanderae TaxID=3035916 RepID=A0ABT8JLE3_9BACL|nr:sodium/pantothenate symporter [Sporosarcina highlanderae]MDN4605961.1 sodium/pantothenate symporter [Sporosarcina highlanderae]